MVAAKIQIVEDNATMAENARELLQRAKQTGSFGYLVKPFEERELYAMLEMTLYKARVEKERRQMQARLMQMEKMEATSRMAAGIAHHFNNMLHIVIGNLEMVREDLPDAGPVVATDLTQIKEILNALLSNAWEAMSKAGGKAIVSVGTSELPEIQDECRFPSD